MDRSMSHPLKSAVRSLARLVSFVAIGSSGCSAYLADSGQDLSKLTSQAQVHEAFGAPVAAGPSCEEFTIHRKIAEPWKCEAITMLDINSIGLAELILLPHESCIAIWRSIKGQQVQFIYDTHGNVTHAYFDGQRVPQFDVPQPPSCARPPSAAPVAETTSPGKVGQTVTLEGTAANAKAGALLQLKDGVIWIDGLDAWPEGFYTRGQGKHLRVTGTVIEKHDLPVFVQRPGEPAPAGIPVTSEEEREKASYRRLLKDAKWTVIE
jgi:hypothetical protein